MGAKASGGQRGIAPLESPMGHRWRGMTVRTRPNKQEKAMDKWECPCGYVYDPAEGDMEHSVKPGTPWEALPEDWVCPKCGAEKEYFEKVGE